MATSYSSPPSVDSLFKKSLKNNMKSVSVKNADLPLWDAVVCRHRVLVLVMEGVGIPAQNVSLRLVVGDKVKCKTASLDTGDPFSWNEFFFFDLPRASTKLLIEVYSKGELVAEGELDAASAFTKDTVSDAWYPLHKVNRKDPSVSGPAGEVHIRLLYSTSSERGREFAYAVDEQSDSKFHDDQYRAFVKDGDLIVYDAIGLLPSLVKVTSCTPYSNLGLVVKLENKFTREMEFYVAELSNNVNHRVDAFTEQPKQGLVLYRLWERLHHANANKVWLCSLQGGVVGPALDQYKKFIWSLHSGEGEAQKLIDTVISSSLPKSIAAFLSENGMSGEKNKLALEELASTNFVLGALASADKIKATPGEVKHLPLKAGTQTAEFKETSYYPPIFAMGAGFYGDPVLLRERLPNPKDAEIDGKEETAAETEDTKRKEAVSSPRAKKGQKRATVEDEKTETKTDAKEESAPTEEDAESPERKEKGAKIGGLFSKKKETPKKEKDEIKDEKKDDKKEEKKEDKKDEKKEDKGGEKKDKPKEEKKEDSKKGSEKKKKDDKPKDEKEKKESVWKNLFGKKKKAPLRTVTAEEAQKNEEVLVAEAAKATRSTFADEVQTLIKRWASTSKEMTFDEFNIVMGELGFDDGVSLSVWEGVEKIDETKIASQSVQTTFCIALSLVSTGTLAQRIQRALNWVKPTLPGKLSLDEILNFSIQFFYLGSETLAFLSKSHKDIVDLIDVRVLVNDLIAALDASETNAIDIQAYIDFLAKADIEWLKTLQEQIAQFHDASRKAIATEEKPAQ